MRRIGLQLLFRGVYVVLKDKNIKILKYKTALAVL